MAESRLSRSFYVPIVKAVITLLLLWGVGAILKELPMIKNLIINKISLSASAIVEMAITLLMVVVLMNFARDFGHQLRRVLPRFPQSSVIFVSLVYIIVIVILYNAFSPLGLSCSKKASGSIRSVFSQWRSCPSGLAALPCTETPTNSLT